MLVVSFQGCTHFEARARPCAMALRDKFNANLTSPAYLTSLLFQSLNDARRPSWLLYVSLSPSFCLNFIALTVLLLTDGAPVTYAFSLAVGVASSASLLLDRGHLLVLNRDAVFIRSQYWRLLSSQMTFQQYVAIEKLLFNID